MVYIENLRIGDKAFRRLQVYKVSVEINWLYISNYDLHTGEMQNMLYGPTMYIICIVYYYSHILGNQPAKSLNYENPTKQKH